MPDARSTEVMAGRRSSSSRPRARTSCSRTTTSVAGTPTSSTSCGRIDLRHHDARRPAEGAAGCPLGYLAHLRVRPRSSGFYGLQYWYTWQVSVLGLGPIWMSKNQANPQSHRRSPGGRRHLRLRALREDARRRHLLDRHGADARRRRLARERPQVLHRQRQCGDHRLDFGRIAGSDEYVFFAADPRHERYHLIKNVVASQSYVSEFELLDYRSLPATSCTVAATHGTPRSTPSTSASTISAGPRSASARTRFYEAITHASNRILYKMRVTDFSHVRQMFVDAYCRLVATKLFALRAADYMRIASPEDRRYLLYNPMVKLKVTTQGEEVINLLWDTIAAKGFEKDTYFGQAAVDIRGLPKLEGTVHVTSR